MRALQPQVFIHPDPLRLEQELQSQIELLKPGFDRRILVIAPSTRLVRRLRRLLASRFGGLLGVEVQTHFEVARFILDRANPGRVPEVLDRSMREVIMDHLLAGREELSLAKYAKRHLSVPAALAGLLGELREAGVRSQDLGRFTGQTQLLELSRLFKDYESTLERLELDREHPRTDRAGLTAAATKAAQELPPLTAVLHFGAYDLVGMNLDLVFSLPTSSLQFFVPSAKDAPVWSFANNFVKERLSSSPVELEESSLRPHVLAANSIGNLQAEPERLSPAQLSLVHAQGSESELENAVRNALGLIESGVAPHRIAIVARTLDPYASVAEPVFQRNGVPVDPSLQSSLSREPIARTFLTLLRSITDDFSRQTVIDLVRSAQLRWPEDIVWQPDLWDRWSRKFGLVDGYESWTQLLPDLLKFEAHPEALSEDPERRERFAQEKLEREASALQLGDFIRQIHEAGTQWKKCRTAEDHSRWLNRLGAKWIRGWESKDPHAETIKKLIGSLEPVDQLIRASSEAVSEEKVPARKGAKLSHGDVFNFLLRRFKEEPVRWSDPGGVAFLDFMQARGLVFDHVFLIGFNSAQIPRPPMEDVFLGDSIRRKLRDLTKRPLSVSADSMQEEQQLLAQVLTSTTEHLTLSWQRANERGTAKAVSLQLQEFAPFLPQSQEALSLDERLQAEPPLGPERVPTHPGLAALRTRERWGMLSELELALAASYLAKSKGTEACQKAFAGLENPEFQLPNRLAFVRAVESTRGNRKFDGDPGAPLSKEPKYSATSLQRLAECPLKYFFRDVLHVRPLDDPAQELRLDARELGTAVHELLERVYQDLLRPEAQIDLFSAAGPLALTPEILKRAEKSLDRHWGSVMEPLGNRVRKRFPIFWEAAAKTWKKELKAFVAKDLKRLHELGFRPEAVEAYFDTTLSVPGNDDFQVPDTSMRIHGYFDRISRKDSGEMLVTDYKTGGNLETWTQPKDYLVGKHIQLPIYLMVAEQITSGAEVDAELLGLGFSFLPDRGFLRTGEVKLPDSFIKHRPGFEEALAVFDSLYKEGRFPFNGPSRHCGWCDFKVACRRHHVPSKNRVEEHTDHENYFLGRKRKATQLKLENIAKGKR